MHPNQQQAQYFLEKIHEYYPIGLPHFEQSYPGYQRLRTIQQEKFAAVQRNEPKSWFDLAAAVEDECSGYRVTNSAAAPFPCYQLSVELFNEQKPGLWRDSSLVLTVSLLVQHYAIFVVDTCTYQGQEHSGVTHKFICSGNQHHLAPESKIAVLEELVSKFFAEHHRAAHSVLFNYKIQGGYPFTAGYQDIGQYTIYDYLFSQELIRDRYTVTH